MSSSYSQLALNNICAAYHDLGVLIHSGLQAYWGNVERLTLRKMDCESMVSLVEEVCC